MWPPMEKAVVVPPARPLANGFAATLAAGLVSNADGAMHGRASTTKLHDAGIAAPRNIASKSALSREVDPSGQTNPRVRGEEVVQMENFLVVQVPLQPVQLQHHQL